MNVVEFHRATIVVGGRTVLSDASFAVEPGEFIGVLGPNGAGKTTLMRAILGLVKPSIGTVHVLGKTPQRGNPAIGYLPQLRTVHPDLRMRGIDFIASSVHGGRWGLPVLSAAESRMIDETISSAGARDLRHAAHIRDVRRRTAASPAGTSAARVAATTPSRRAADQPRLPAPGGLDRPCPALQSRAPHRGDVQRP